MAQSTARAISGEPLTRPPTSSVSLRKVSSRGDSPMTMGVILAAACAHEEASVAEHPAVPWIAGRSVSLFGEGIWATTMDATDTNPKADVMRRNANRFMKALSLLSTNEQPKQAWEL